MRLVIFILLLFGYTANAQSVTGGASQTTNISLSDIIDISFFSTANNTGNLVVMPFTSVNDYANGVTSNEQQLVIRSNKRFNIRVKARTSRFSYAGNTSPAPKMSVSNVLKIQVLNNSTGGQIGNGYTAFKAVSTTAREIIKNAAPGDNNTVSVKYKATPGYTYPAGNYSVDIIYTATQS